jgi:cell wall-associated NlpC family hydrolase
MKATWIWVVTLGSIVVLAGCGNQDRSYGKAQRTPETARSLGIDNRLVDPRIADRDLLLRKGDAGIENVLTGAETHGMNQSSAGGGQVTMLGGLVRVSPNPAISPYQGGYVENVLATAARYFGTPYEYASDRSTDATFDCSDFTRWVYLYSLGMDLPKDSRKQAQYVESFSGRSYRDISQAQRGDILFFIGYHGTDPEDYYGQSKRIEDISHTGIYLGNGKMIHTASQRTGGVRIDPVFGNHLEARFVLGGSVLE